MSEPTNSKKDKEKSKVVKHSNAYLKYAGMGFQFFALMLIAVFAGQKLDDWAALKQPLFTIFFILFFTIGYFVKLYYELFDTD